MPRVTWWFDEYLTSILSRILDSSGFLILHIENELKREKRTRVDVYPSLNVTQLAFDYEKEGFKDVRKYR